MVKYTKKIFAFVCILFALFIILNFILNIALGSIMISDTIYFKKYSLYDNLIILGCDTTVLDFESKDIVLFFNSISNNFIFNKTKCYNVKMVDRANNCLLSAKFLNIDGDYYINELLCNRYILSPDFINELNTTELEKLEYKGQPIKNNFAFLDQCYKLKKLCIDSKETILDIDLLLSFTKMNDLEYFEVVLYDDLNNKEQNYYRSQLCEKITETNPNCKIVILFSN